MTPPRRRLLSALVALSEAAEADDLPHAAWLLSCVGRAVVRGDERDLALAWCWLESELDGTALDAAWLVGAGGAGTDGASAGGGLTRPNMNDLDRRMIGLYLAILMHERTKGPTMLSEFKLETVHEVEGGKVAAAFDRHVRRASDDCRDL